MSDEKMNDIEPPAADAAMSSNSNIENNHSILTAHIEKRYSQSCPAAQPRRDSCLPSNLSKQLSSRADVTCSLSKFRLQS